MQTIDLECPGCRTNLELDAGFAGGVCRCFKCGTLMTVPADPKRERAEKLSRPSRPDAPGGSSGRPSEPAAPQRPAAPARPGAKPAAAPPKGSDASARPAAPAPPAAGKPGRPAAPAAPPGPAKTAARSGDSAAGESVAPSASIPSPVSPASIAAGAAQTFVTASGKVITISAKVIPTARKRRKIVRASAVILYVIVVGSIAAACIGAVVLLSRSGEPTPKGGEASVEKIDPDANPFQLPGPNVLGIPLQGRSVVVVEAGADASPWMSVMIDAILTGTRRLDAKQGFQVVLWGEDSAMAFPDEPQPFSAADRAALRDYLNGYILSGTPGPEVAVAKALLGKPQQMILITGQSLSDERIGAIRKMVDAQPALRVDVIQVGREDAGLQAIAAKHNGRYISPAVSRLSSWYRLGTESVNVAAEELKAVPPSNITVRRHTRESLAPPATTAPAGATTKPIASAAHPASMPASQPAPIVPMKK